MAILLAAMPALWARPPRADDHRHFESHGYAIDHDEARQALIRGEVIPLEQVLAAVRPEVEGDFVGAELEVEHDIWVYDLKFIDRQGVLRKIHVNAKSAKILSRDRDPHK